MVWVLLYFNNLEGLYRIFQRQDACGPIMNIHEYQAKAMFNDSGIKVVKGIHCLSIETALKAYDKLESKVVAVKS